VKPKDLGLTGTMLTNEGDGMARLQDPCDHLSPSWTDVSIALGIAHGPRGSIGAPNGWRKLRPIGGAISSEMVSSKKTVQ
jgi:hypothetical protein